jgi:hypothetical protein
MSISSWLKGGGFGFGLSSSLMEDSEPDYSQMTMAEIELRERVVHRVNKLDRLALDLERVDGRRKETSLGSEASEVVWPKPNAGYDPSGFTPCMASVPFEAQRMKEGFVVRTRTGPLRGNAGDYLVRMPNGNMCIFEAVVFDQLFKLCSTK